MKAASGCPVGFFSGCRFQDNEDYSTKTFYGVFPSDGRRMSSFVAGKFNRNLNLCYCVKRYDDKYFYKWPAGRYCIGKKTRCPSGFREGEIIWDDEDVFNDNSLTGFLPDGTYNHNTHIKYCCRNDGNPNHAILLPTEKPFILYKFQSRACQKVSGMSIRHLFIRTDSERFSNDNSCKGAHPYTFNTCQTRKTLITACYYYPTKQID